MRCLTALELSHRAHIADLSIPSYCEGHATGRTSRWGERFCSTLFVFTTWSTRSSTEQVRSCSPLPGVSFSSGLGADRRMDHVVFPLALPGGTPPVPFTAYPEKPWSASQIGMRGREGHSIHCRCKP